MSDTKHTWTDVARAVHNTRRRERVALLGTLLDAERAAAQVSHRVRAKAIAEKGGAR